MTRASLTLMIWLALSLWQTPVASQEAILGRGQAATISDTVPDRLLVCNLPPLAPTCVVGLLGGQDSIQFSVRVHPALRRPVNDSVPVTIATSRCCVNTQSVRPDRNGYVNVLWKAAQEPDTAVQIRFAMTGLDGILWTDSVVLVPHKDPPKVTRATATTPYLGTVPRYVWVRNDHIPVPVPVVIDSLRGVSNDSLPERCETVRVVFQARMGSAASPDTAQALWHPRWDPKAKRWDSTRGSCVAETRWKLADDAGEQQMDVVVTGENIAHSRFSITAFAREAPRLSGGFGYFTALRQDHETTCAEARESSRCAGKPDSAGVTVQRRDDAVEPYFGLEFPIFFGYRVSSASAVGRYLSEHLRIVMGSTFKRPGDNLFVGLALMPLVSGASEASPFQVSAGLGRGGWRTRYIGMSLDASTIVAPILKTIGVPGL